MTRRNFFQRFALDLAAKSLGAGGAPLEISAHFPDVFWRAITLVWRALTDITLNSQRV
jgi:hypothetical protein